jgi:hypothetical protein
VEFRAKQPALTNIRALVGIIFVLGITANEAVTAADKPGDDNDAERVTELLALAAAAVRAEQLIYPARGSAMSLYHEVLTLAPDNLQARRGLEQLVDHYLVQASEAIAEERYASAHGALSRARMIDRSNPNIEPIAAELRLLEEAKRYRTALDWRQVANRSGELRPALHLAGAQARKDGCRAIISVGSDSEGRWVYQQMSNAPGERRIRAQIRIASPSAVEVLCFTDTDSQEQ